MAVQRQWMYLEPIFSSEDIMQQLPLEGKRFATVDRMWRKATEVAKKNPLVLKVCGFPPCVRKTLKKYNNKGFLFSLDAAGLE